MKTSTIIFSFIKQVFFVFFRKTLTNVSYSLVVTEHQVFVFLPFSPQYNRLPEKCIEHKL